MPANLQNLVCNFKDLLADFLVTQNVNIVKNAATVLKIVGTERVTEQCLVNLNAFDTGNLVEDIIFAQCTEDINGIFKILFLYCVK